MYKIISKALPYTIANTQAAFVEGRQFIHAILVATSVGRPEGLWGGGFLLKLDLEKAYDKVNWAFLRLSVGGKRVLVLDRGGGSRAVYHKPTSLC